MASGARKGDTFTLFPNRNMYAIDAITLCQVVGPVVLGTVRVRAGRQSVVGIPETANNNDTVHMQVKKYGNLVTTPLWLGRLVVGHVGGC